MSASPPVALTIAGSDSGGGAGLQADLRTFTACGVHGCVAVTAVTVQNSVGVTAVVEIPPSTVADQVRAVADDIGVAAVKTGMLASAAIIRAVAQVCDEVGIGRCRAVALVVDPVAASMHGDPLLAEDALAMLRSELLPRATLVTPNLDEVRLLVGLDIGSPAEQREAARALHALGPRWVLVKGGHLRGDSPCLDLLYDGSELTAFTSPRLATPHTHGSGDTLAAAITSALARGTTVPQAVGYGKRYVEQAVAHAYPLGAGVGPVSPFWRLRPETEPIRCGGKVHKPP
ncbi:MAG: bifunctional hydroxymethylpyrimidine kinase/phosphomethylpyrimidine kinase [Pseudonocardiales bacterium]|nr:bifunctional hydroxymethylpyrimidine kinase/phosphomethylpyrimidine kinase [Pseudonocardiales bacterium]MBV9030260.1 bifunctional hydroxymethylpyrimidine kinase/phosphomethylpyrimidine kinase [Pseudonocardiales bacterium]